MTLKSLAKRVTKSALAAVSLSISRITPANADYKLAPDPSAEFDWLKNSNICTILDIGANTGQFATKINTILPAASIYAFEPLPECHEQLVLNGAHIRAFDAFCIALGDTNATTTINRNNFTPSSSLLDTAPACTKAFPFTRQTQSRSIEVRRLDDVIKDINIVDNMLIKIDVQGFEDRVIAGGTNTIQRASHMIVETSFERLYHGQPLFDDIYTSLKRMGFIYRGAIEQLTSPQDGRVLQQDSVFHRAAPRADWKRTK